MAHAEQINPRMLTWARETAGLSVEEAAASLGLKDSAKATAAEKLLALEAGRRDPGLEPRCGRLGLPTGAR